MRAAAAAVAFAPVGRGGARPGATGRLVVKELAAQGYDVVAGIRSEEKARDTGVAALASELTQLDVTNAPDAIAAGLPKGIDAIVCATGFVPGNPFKMGAAAHAVDNVGTRNLIAAASLAGIDRFVLVSSILTNGRAIGQEKSPGFVITNAFGGVLDEKLEAENALRASGLSYTIVRPGGLKDEVTSPDVIVAEEDSLYSGEVSRANVAAVCVEALGATSSVNSTVEVVEFGTCLDNQCPGAEGKTGSQDRAQWFA